MSAPIKLDFASRQEGRADSRASFGDFRGGGATTSFGGINDSPGGKWFWPAVIGGVLLVVVAVVYFVTRKGS